MMRDENLMGSSSVPMRLWSGSRLRDCLRSCCCQFSRLDEGHVRDVEPKGAKENRHHSLVVWCETSEETLHDGGDHFESSAGEVIL